MSNYLTAALVNVIQGRQPMNFDALQIHQMREEIASLNDALNKAETVGYQTPASMSPDGGNLAPLYAQSIDNVVADLVGYNEEDFEFYKMLPHDKATQTGHEWAAKESLGSPFLTGRAAEGDISPLNQSEFSRGSVRIKYWVETRSLTNVGAQVPGLAGNNMALETKNAATENLRRMDLDSMYGNSAIDPLAIDGVFTQIQNASGVASAVNPRGVDTYLDKEGATISFAEIAEILRQMTEPTIGAKPKVALVTRHLYTDMVNQAIAGAMTTREFYETRDYKYGSNGLFIKTPAGVDVPVKPVTFMDQQNGLFGSGPTAAVGSTLCPATPVIASASAGSLSGSKFKAGDVGAYIYRIAATSAEGSSAFAATSPVTISAAGQGVTISVTNPGSNPPTFYRVWRSEKNGAAATCKYLFDFKYSTSGGATDILDKNLERYNTGKMLIANFSPEQMCWYDLLPTVRVPLAQVTMRIPFAIFSSGAVAVKAASKQKYINNIGFATGM